MDRAPGAPTTMMHHNIMMGSNTELEDPPGLYEKVEGVCMCACIMCECVCVCVCACIICENVLVYNMCECACVHTNMCECACVHA